MGDATFSGIELPDALNCTAMIDLLATFIVFFAVIDPIGTVPVYIAVTSKLEESAKRLVAIQSTLIAALILLFFVLAGEVILTALDIPLSAFQIAGGIVLFLFALTMIFGDGKPQDELKMVASARETAIFPLAVPSIASPGAMLAAVMQTENTRFTIVEQAQVSGMILAVLAVVLVLMLASSFVHRIIGNGGASVISRVMGLILSSVAVASVLSGIQNYFLI
jgi:multiple antibiotic resistance protein